MKKYFIKTLAFIVCATSLSCMDSSIGKENIKTVKYWIKNYVGCPASYTDVYLPLKKKYLPVGKDNKTLKRLVKFLKKNVNIEDMSVVMWNKEVYIKMHEAHFNDLRKLIED